jgi:O-antigen ligase
MEFFKNSLALHFLKPLLPVVKFFKNSYEHSAVVLCGAAMARSYELSKTKKMWEAFCSCSDPAGSSAYRNFLLRIEKKLHRLGAILRESLFFQGIDSISALYFRATQGSAVFSRINRVPFHRWFLISFALYLPIEFMLRDVLGLSALSAVWEELFIAAALLVVLWRTMLKQSPAFSRATLLETCILLFMAIGLLLMMLNRPFPSVAFAGYRAQVEYMVWFFLVLRLIKDKEDAKAVVYAFAATVFVLCLHGIYQYIAGVDIPDAWTSQTEMDVRTRVFSITGSPNIFGSLIVMAAPTVAALIYYCQKTFWKIFYFICTGLMCLCILFTFSRGAWVGLIVAVVLFALYVDKRLLGIMAAAMALILAAVPSITSRLTYLFTSDYAEASAIGGRTLRWEVGRNLLMENSPWLGFGLGRFGGAVAMNNQLLDETEEFSYFYMDNYYLKTLVEMGYTGLLFFLLVLLVFILWGMRSVSRSGQNFHANRGRDPLVRNAGNDKLLSAGIFSGLAGVLTHCYFENIFEEPYMMAYFWGLAAVLIFIGFFQGGVTHDESPNQTRNARGLSHY